MRTWERISQALGVKPVASAEIGGLPLRVERYIFQLNACDVPPLDSMVLACHLGGARATIRRPSGRPLDFIPSSSAVFQPGFASRWMFGGAIDIAMFHFIDTGHEKVRQLEELLARRGKSAPLTDPLVAASAQQLLAEIGGGAAPNHGFLARLSELMIEQACRVIEGSSARRPAPEPLHLGRLQSVLEWIKQNLSEELSNAELAERAGV